MLSAEISTQHAERLTVPSAMVFAMILNSIINNTFLYQIVRQDLTKRYSIFQQHIHTHTLN